MNVRYKNVLWIFIPGIMIITIGIIIKIGVPQVKKYIILKSRISQAVLQLENYYQYLQAKDEYTQQWIKTKEILSLLEQRCYKGETITLSTGHLLEDIQRISHDAGCYIVRMDILPHKVIDNDKEYYQIGLEFKIIATSKQFARFLYNLTNAPRLYQITYMSISKQDDKKLDVEIRMSSIHITS
jgi:hypothetical protein